MRISKFLPILLIGFVFMTLNSVYASGLSCSSSADLGKTQMSDDGKGIYACLSDGSGGFISVPMATTEEITCPDGQVLKGTSKGRPACESVTCPAGQVLKGVSNGQPVCQMPFGGIYMTGANCNDNACRYANPMTGDCSCPSGFSASPVWEYVSASGIYADNNSACFASVHVVSLYQCVWK